MAFFGDRSPPDSDAMNCNLLLVNLRSLQLQDFFRLLLLKQLSELAAPEEKQARESIDDDLDVHNEVVRQIPLSHRERKTGCRNFYWKTFTSC